MDDWLSKIIKSNWAQKYNCDNKYVSKTLNECLWHQNSKCINSKVIEHDYALIEVLVFKTNHMQYFYRIQKWCDQICRISKKWLFIEPNEDENWECLK